MKVHTIEAKLASCERTAEVIRVNYAFILRFDHLVGIHEKSIVVILKKADQAVEAMAIFADRK